MSSSGNGEILRASEVHSLRPISPILILFLNLKCHSFAALKDRPEPFTKPVLERSEGLEGRLAKDLDSSLRSE